MCTGIQLTAEDSSIVFARTMEFGIDLKSDVLVIPRHFKLKAHAPNGYEWTSKYAAVGCNAENMTVLVDGINEKGLSFGLFYFPNYAKFQKVSADEKNMASFDLGTWILTQYASVQEVREAIANIKVSNAVFEKWGFTCPAHYIVNDPTGACVVIEYIDGELQVHDNPVKVFTNPPDFKWHLTNCSNYVHLQPNNQNTITFNGHEVKHTGEGSGLLGMPGDFTPPSRFIRAAVFSHTVFPAQDAQSNVMQAFHILNNFDIPKGSVRAEEHGIQFTDHTLWTSAHDCNNRRYYFHTYDNRCVRMVDLMKNNLDSKEIRVISMAGKTPITVV